MIPALYPHSGLCQIEKLNNVPRMNYFGLKPKIQRKAKRAALKELNRLNSKIAGA